MRFSRKTLTITISVLLLAFLIVGVVLWLFSVSGQICIARTSVAPDSRLFESVYFKKEAQELKEGIEEALTRAFDEERGFFLYESHPDGTVYARDNDIRQFLASRALALMANGDDALRALHEKNLTTIMTEWYLVEGEYGYAYAYEKSKLGGNALLIRVLVASPLFETYRTEAERLGNTILVAQKEDGSFKAWLKEPGYAYDEDYLLTFYSGEAILALLELHDRTGEEKWLEAAKKAQDFYIGEYVTRMKENYYPAYVPWHTLSLANLYEKTHDERYRDAVFVLTDELLLMQDTQHFIGRFYNERTPQYGTPHASSDAVYTEGLAVAYRLSKEAGDVVREEKYHNALVMAFTNLKTLQFNASLFRVFDDREMAEQISGGIRKNACSFDIRIDSTAHTFDALNSILKEI